MMERKINEKIESSFLRSDFMIERIAEARRFWSDKARAERKKKKQHALIQWLHEDNTITFL